MSIKRYLRKNTLLDTCLRHLEASATGSTPRQSESYNKSGRKKDKYTSGAFMHNHSSTDIKLRRQAINMCVYTSHANAKHRTLCDICERRISGGIACEHQECTNKISCTVMLTTFVLELGTARRGQEWNLACFLFQVVPLKT